MRVFALRGAELAIELDLASGLRRYQATVSWGVRAWFRDEPCTIELRGDHLDPVEATAGRHPQVWRLLRDHARRALAAEQRTAALARYGTDAVTDAIVEDLLARGDAAALYALVEDAAPGEVPRGTWERFLRAHP